MKTVSLNALKKRNFRLFSQCYGFEKLKSRELLDSSLVKQTNLKLYNKGLVNSEENVYENKYSELNRFSSGECKCFN